MYNNYVKTTIETTPAAECNAHEIGDYTRRSTRTLFPFMLGIKTRPEDRGNRVSCWNQPIFNARRWWVACERHFADLVRGC